MSLASPSQLRLPRQKFRARCASSRKAGVGRFGICKVVLIPASSLRSGHFPQIFTFSRVLAFVPMGLSPGEGEFNLGQTSVVKIDPQWNQRLAFDLDFCKELADFPSVEKKIFWPLGIVVEAVSLLIGLYRKIMQGDLALIYACEGLGDAGVAMT